MQPTLPPTLLPGRQPTLQPAGPPPVPSRILDRARPRAVPGSPEPAVTGSEAEPSAFSAALRSLRDALRAPDRPGLTLRTVPAPRRLAPWAVAVAGEVAVGGSELASGRLVVLHDPDGQDGWFGDTRVIALVEAQVEPEMAADPALGGVGWSWLVDALAGRGADHVAEGGTVTRTISTRFGALEHPADTCDVEIRASWTAVAGPGGLHLGAHLLAWCDVLAATAGLPPPGVTALRRRR